MNTNTCTVVGNVRETYEALCRSLGDGQVVIPGLMIDADDMADRIKLCLPSKEPRVRAS